MEGTADLKNTAVEIFVVAVEDDDAKDRVEIVDDHHCLVDGFHRGWF